MTDIKLFITKHANDKMMWLGINKGQVKRAVVSVPLNIAEGCSRFSKKGFLQFLSYSYGSLRELEVLFMLGRDLKFMKEEEYLEIEEKRDRVSKKLFLFMKKFIYGPFGSIFSKNS